MSEDDTTYEGDFSDDWTLNGKVIRSNSCLAAELHFVGNVLRGVTVLL